MALVRIDEKTLIQKIKVFIIGNEKPNWLTRISIIVGFAIWLYFIIYLSIIFLSILFVDTLQDPELIKSTFGKIGGQYNFNIDYANLSWQAIDVIFYHALISICLLGISLVGLILIYRRKKMGYILYLSGNAVTTLFTILFLGLTYFKDQITLTDKLLFAGITIYFLIAMIFLQGNKDKLNATPEQQS
jgi:hypothetical protein